MNQTLAIAGIMAVAGAVATGWSHIQGFFSRISNYLIVNASVDGGELYWAVSNHLYKNFKKSPFAERNYQGREVFVRPIDRHQIVAFEEIGSATVFFWCGWRPLWVTFSKDKGDPAAKMKLSFIRGLFDLEKFLIGALDAYNDARGSNKVTGGRYEVNFIFGRRYSRGDGNRGSGQDEPMDASSPKMVHQAGKLECGRALKWKSDELGPKLVEGGKPTDLLVLSKVAADAVNEARFWRESEDWYKARSIPWKFGWLLYGRPGTGKTSMARAVAQELDLPIFVFDVASLSNEELRDGWRRMLRSVPCMAVIEDIDGTFHGRTNVVAAGRADGGLTFDALLNALDGIERSDGVLVVVTTNDISKVDPAIGVPQDGRSSRPGRIDRVIEMTPPDREGLMRVARRILDEQPEMWEQMSTDAHARTDTVAQFQDLCGKLALAHRYELRRQSALVRKQVDETTFVGRDANALTMTEIQRLLSQGTNLERLAGEPHRIDELRSKLKIVDGRYVMEDM